MTTSQEIIWRFTCTWRNNLLKLVHVLKSMADHPLPFSTQKEYSATNSPLYTPFMSLRKPLLPWQRAAPLFALVQQLNEILATAYSQLTDISKPECHFA